MCLYSRLIQNPKYTKTKKNGGVIPPVKDKRVTLVAIGCTKCIECLRKRANEWKVRLMEDVKRNTNAKFVTMTFSDESITSLSNEIDGSIKGYDRDNAIATLGVRRFLERWRKKYKKSLRHWFVTEIGGQGTENIHIHGLIWTNEETKTVAEKWQYGFIWPKESWTGNYVNEQTVNYISKYLTKVDTKHKYYKPIILTSAGIGRGYEVTPEGRLNKYNGEDTKDTYKTRQGIKVALPIYYRNKIYTDDEREKLWLHKLDKGDIYVLGVRYKARKAEEYLRAMKAARKLNREWGYSGPKKSWKQEEYEKKLRMLLQETRIARARKEMPAAWQLEAYANASADNKGRGTADDCLRRGFSSRDLDIWGEEDRNN